MNIPRNEVKTWIRALRSGDYKQTTGSLQSADGFCCLGVACDLFIPKKEKQLGKKGFLVGCNVSDQPAAPKWLLDIQSVGFSEAHRESLVYLNDVEKLTFNEIADLLQAVYIHEVLK